MKKFILTISFIFPLISFATNYFVSNSGSDANNGTSPGTSWQTAAKVNSMMSTFNAGDIIRFNRGDVWTESLLIGKSGASGNPIRFATYGSGANPKFSGFQTISAWSSIATNLWLSSAAATTLATLNMVTVGGNFTPIGRWPDATYSDIVSAVGNTSLTGAGVPAGVTGGQVVIRKNHWIIDKSTITSQTGGNTLNFLSPNNYPITVGCFGGSCWGFLVQNCQAVCTAQNEWWFDAGTKKIGMFSVGTPPTTKVSTIDVILNVGIFSFVRFDSLDFEGSNSYTVNVTSGNNIDFENCNFSLNGINCFNVQSAAHHITVNNSTLERTNNNGINGGGSANWLITNNLFHNTAQVPGMGLSSDGNYIAMYNMGPNSLIQYNRIIKTGYSGIDFRGNSNQILNNLVDTFCNVKDDGAGIYTYTGVTAVTYTQRFVQNNIIVNGGNAGAGTSTTNGDASGIYMDANSSQVTISGNTVGNCDGVGIFLNGDHDLTITGNTFYNCPRTGSYGTVLEIYPTVDATLPVRNLTFTGNKIVARATNQLVGYLKTSEVDMKLWGLWDNNYWCRPINDAISTSTFTLINNGATQITNLAGWVAKAPGEVNSLKSPVNISNLADLRFDYNATKVPVVVNLGGFNYIDVAGVSYPGSITLAAYSSAVLIKQGTANNFPVVSAGVDQTITLPTSQVSVTGTATDADGTISSRLWTKISGPAATITSPTLATTTITGLTQGVYIFQFSATDNLGATSVDQMQVTVNPAANQLPTANAGVDRTIQLPTNTVTQTGSGTDPDGTIAAFLWTQVSGPSTATIVSATQATTSFNNLVAGTYIFNLRVTDNQGATGNDQFQITVNPAVNQPPTASAGTNQTITLPINSVTLTGSGTDPDGTISSYAWTKIVGPATFTILSPASATTGVNNLVAGTYVFQLTVTDNQGATASSTVQVLVNAAPPPNQPPVANAGTDKNITLPANSITQVGIGNDPDGTVTAYAWTKVSGPATFTIASPASSTTVINNLVAGTYVFQLTVTDNQGAIGTDQMTVIVNPAANVLPTANAGTDQTLTLPTTSSTLIGTASDPDGAIISTAWTFLSGPGPTPVIAAPTSLSTGISNMTVAGSYQYRLSATDNQGATATDNIIVLVNNAPNQPPTADAGADKNITLPVNFVTQVGGGTDADGTIVSYLWTRLSGPGTFNIGSPTQATTQINNLIQGTYIFNLRVTDNNGAIGNDQVTIVVNGAVNIPPTANAGTNKNITLPTNSVTQTGSGTDPDGTITAYLWTKISGPATFNIVSPASATTVINNLVAGTYVFQLQVTDNQGATATNTVQIVVNPAPNIPPTANAGANQSITLPTSSVTLSGSGTDPDGTITAYLWTKISGPATFTIVSPTSASTAVNNLVAGTYVFQLQVTDNNGATATNTVQIVVNPAPPPNQPPIANAGTDKNITLPTNTINQVGSGTDADGTVVSYAWTKISGPATFTIGSPFSATTAISNLVAGTYVFRLTVTDNVGATGTDDMSVIVNPAPNQPPIANAGTDKNITLPANSVSQVGSGTDADGTVVSYAWSKISGPATFTIVSPASSTTTINNLVAGTYVFRLTVTDNVGATGTDDATIIVNPAPNAPPGVSAGPDQAITLPTSSSTFAGIATDQDGTITSTTWSFIAGPGPTPVIATPGSLTSGVSNMTTAGSYTFQLSATDNSAATRRDTMIILVNPAPNIPPTSNAGADQVDSMPLLNDMITLTGTASDVDGTIIGILWTQPSGPAGAEITSATQLTTTVHIINAGVYVFRLQISDNTGITTTDDVTITIVTAITPQPTGPTANAGPDQKVIIPFFQSTSAAVVTGTGTPGIYPIVGYTWTKIAGPASSLIMSPNTATTALRNLARGTYLFQLTVTDSFGNTATDTVLIDVRKQWITIRHGKVIIEDY